MGETTCGTNRNGIKKALINVKHQRDCRNVEYNTEETIFKNPSSTLIHSYEQLFSEALW